MGGSRASEPTRGRSLLARTATRSRFFWLASDRLHMLASIRGPPVPCWSACFGGYGLAGLERMLVIHGYSGPLLVVATILHAYGVGLRGWGHATRVKIPILFLNLGEQVAARLALGISRVREALRRWKGSYGVRAVSIDFMLSLLRWRAIDSGRGFGVDMPCGVQTADKTCRALRPRTRTRRLCVLVAGCNWRAPMARHLGQTRRSRAGGGRR
jgi:hypothetical protein